MAAAELPLKFGCVWQYILLLSHWAFSKYLVFIYLGKYS